MSVPRLADLAAGALGSPASRQRRLEAADVVLRSPLALNRRIAFMQLHGGVGASATAAAVASVVAHRRSGAVLAVNASGGPRSALWHAGLGETAPTPADRRREQARRFADAISGLPVSASGLHGLDVHEEGSEIAVAEPVWGRALAPIVRFFDVTCTDWGLRGPRADLPRIAGTGQVVCLVTRGERPAVEQGLAVAAGLRALGPRTVLAAVDIGDSAPALPAGLGAGTVDGLVRIPFEPSRRALAPAPSRAWTARSRTALIELAAALLDTGGQA